MEEPPLISRAREHPGAVAFHSESEECSYQRLLDRSDSIAAGLLETEEDLNESRVAFLVPAGPDYAAVQWGIWRAGGVAVPLCLAATESEWEYTLTDSDAAIVIADEAHADGIRKLTCRLDRRFVTLPALLANPPRALPAVAPERRAMILYTSGTTSRPKGVVTTHANIEAQIRSLVDAWHWSADDRIPLFLPLHHVHGIINVMSCALWSGATVEPFEGFHLPKLLERIRADAYSIFMAVPTIYVKLIQALEGLDRETSSSTSAAFGRMRLMVSGSAALPASVHERWTELTGQKLLERYGMTEIGMALSNPYDGERRPGAVGQALPGVEIRLKSENGDLVTGEDQPGEIQVRGPGVFAEYWQRPETTRESFDGDWFRTGDMAVLERGYLRIMGRLSVDIIKSGGYKLSGLEIESSLLLHPAIRECAVVGVPDETWGEAVAAAVVLRDGHRLELTQLREWCRDRLSHYKIPKLLHILPALPRNAMGKVQKKALVQLLAP